MKRRLSILLGSFATICLVLAGAQVGVNVYRTRLYALAYEPPPAGMVFVPAGNFLMGSDDPSAEPDERPLRTVFLPAFYIDRFEVTNRRYKEFKKDHSYPVGEDDLPVTFVHKSEAEAFCRWAGRRLPTNAEWEKAARGPDGRIYPWGNQFRAECANFDRRANFAPIASADCKSPLAASTGKLTVGSFPKGASPYGCQDMAGNVWEWVSDVWADRTALGLKSTDEPRGILRGGASRYSPRQARASYHGFEAVGATCHDVGFRCAKDAVPRKR